VKTKCNSRNVTKDEGQGWKGRNACRRLWMADWLARTKDPLETLRKTVRCRPSRDVPKALNGVAALAAVRPEAREDGPV